MQTFSDLIDAYGIRALSELLGVNDSHVRTMKARDSIPPEYWPALIGHPPQGVDLTFDALMEIRTSKKRGAA